MIPIFDALMPILSKVLDFIPDPQKKAEAQLKLKQEIDANEQAIMTALLGADKAQTDINIEEAKSSSLFVSGWRPSLGWVCSAAFAWVYLLQPMVAFFFNAVGHPVTLPHIEFGEMSTVLFGILGLGGMRTFEKIKGVAAK